MLCFRYKFITGRGPETKWVYIHCGVIRKYIFSVEKVYIGKNTAYEPGLIWIWNKRAGLAATPYSDMVILKGFTQQIISNWGDWFPQLVFWTIP